MNRTIAGVFKMHMKDSAISQLIFWSILLITFVLLLWTASLFNGQVFAGGASPLYIYMLVAAIVGLKDTLPYALGMSVRRRDYFGGSVLFAIAMAVFMGVCVTILSQIEHAIVRSLPLQFHFFYMPSYEQMNVATELWTQIVFLLHMYFLGMFLCSISLRFGQKGMYAFAAIVFLAIVLLHLFKAWSTVFAWIANAASVSDFAIGLLPFIALYVLGSFALLRRVTL